MACALGVECPVFEAEQASTTLFKGCQMEFCRRYEAYTGLPYRFGARDGSALSSIITQIRSVLEDKDDTQVLVSFCALVENLPEWYKVNQFNLPVIDRKFNDIVVAIKKNQNGSSTGKVSDEYKRRVLGDLLA